MAEPKRIVINRVERKTQCALTIRGVSDLLVSRMPEHVKLPDESVEDKTVAKAKPKTPEAIYEASRYMIDEKTHGFPASGFKKAMVFAIRFIGAKKTELNMKLAMPMFFVAPVGPHPKFTPLRFDSVCMDHQVGRNQMGNAVDCYRARYTNWECDVIVRFQTGFFTVQDIVNLLSTAGDTCGVGCMRPERGYEFGQFDVEVTGKAKAKGRGKKK